MARSLTRAVHGGQIKGVSSKHLTSISFQLIILN